MVMLRDMRAEEFPAYLAYFLPDYAEEISAAVGLDATAARARAGAEIARDLPLGVATPGHQLLCIDRAGTLVGYLWLRPEPGGAFILDFHILPAHQRQGLARDALAALQARLTAAGTGQLRLRVAAGNSRAQAVYAAAGFRVTGINMARNF